MFTDIRKLFGGTSDGLAGDMPKIVWVKSVESYTTVAFAARYSGALAEKVAGADIIMKAEDGRFFVRKKWDKGPMWHGLVNGTEKTFRSPYLDSILEMAVAGGMRTQRSSFDIFSSLMHARRFICFSGSDKQFETIDSDYPSCPPGFSDHNVPEDYDGSHPHFAAYLRANGYVPFRITAAQGQDLNKKPSPGGPT